MLNKVSKQPDSNDKISDILYQRGLIYADRLQQPEKAIADLQRYVQLNPGSADGMNALGYTILSDLLLRRIIRVGVFFLYWYVLFPLHTNVLLICLLLF